MNLRLYVGASGQTLYVRVDNSGTYIAVALTEGVSGGLGNYTVAESALVTAGLTTASTGSGFPYTIRSGAPSTTATDPILAYGDLAWSGSAEITVLARLGAPAGASIAADIAGVSGGGPFLQRRIATDHVLQAKVVSGQVTVIGRLRMQRGTGPLTWAVECAGTELAPGDNVDSMSAPAATGTGVTVGSVAGSTYGTNNSRLLFTVTVAANATVGDSNITIAFSPNSGESQTVTVPVTVY